MADDTVTLKDAVKNRGPYVVWELLTEDEQDEAARALWENSDRPSRTVIEQALAKEMKFRPQSVRKLSAERVAPRLRRLADDLPDTVLFQFLFHLHMAARKPLLVEFLDAVGLPHTDGVLDLGDEPEAPDAKAVAKAGKDLVKAHHKQALVYLATLKVADEDFWEGLDPVLEAYGEDGEKR